MFIYMLLLYMSYVHFGGTIADNHFNLGNYILFYTITTLKETLIFYRRAFHHYSLYFSISLLSLVVPSFSLGLKSNACFNDWSNEDKGSSLIMSFSVGNPL